MSLRMQIYNELVNKHSGIRERYMEVHCKQTPFSKINSYFVLLWLNVRYYILKDWTLDYIKIVRENEQKNLKTDVPESLFATEYSATHILQAVKDYDIISFDIFDTLIFRPFSAPTDLFDYLAEQIGILDFKSVRIAQEWKARQDKFAVSGSYEVTLEEIWNRIEYETGYPAGKGRNLEEELEQRFCYANPVMHTVFKELQRRKKTIIITSDMYLSEAFLEKLLAQNGYSGIQKLYISSEYNAGKSDGTIYDYVKEDFEKEKIIHIGDNEISDITNAKKAGLAVFYYPNVNKHSKAYRAYDMSLMVGAAYRGIVNNHMYCGNNSYSMEYEYGYIYGGLFVLGYCTFIHDYYKKNGIDKILFLSRDGDIIKQVYNKLYQEDSTEYVYWSRKAATKLMAEDDRHDYFRRFIEHKVNQQHKRAEILEAMELQELGREHSREEIAERLGTTKQKVEEALEISRDPVSMDSPIGEEEDSSLGDFIEDENMLSPSDSADYQMLKKELVNALDTLTDRERKVIELRFGLIDGQARTLEEVGKEFKVTRERIRQIEAKALRKLRHPSRSRKLKDFLQE